YYLGIGRNVALKVPADCDGLELSASLTAIEGDSLGTALNLINSDEFKKPLELAPSVVGEVLTISSFVKNLFSSTNPKHRLDATFPGILSVSPVDHPVANNRLVEGYLIMICRNSDNDAALDGLDANRLTVDGDGLKVDGQPMQNTYMVYNITLDK